MHSKALTWFLAVITWKSIQTSFSDYSIIYHIKLFNTVHCTILLYTTILNNIILYANLIILNISMCCTYCNWSLHHHLTRERYPPLLFLQIIHSPQPINILYCCSILECVCFILLDLHNLSINSLQGHSKHGLEIKMKHCGGTAYEILKSSQTELFIFEWLKPYVWGNWKSYTLCVKRQLTVTDVFFKVLRMVSVCGGTWAEEHKQPNVVKLQ